MLKKIICIVLVFAMAVSLVACASSGTDAETSTSLTSNTVTSAGTSTNVTMTAAGTPRAETLVIQSLKGTITDTSILNFYLSGCVNGSYGFRQCVYEALWDIDQTTGEQYPVLAEGMAEPMDDTYTKFEVKLRQGVKWSDGEDFTAEDVVFTANMLINNPELTFSASFTNTIKSITEIDDYTIEIETWEKETRIEEFLGIVSCEANFNIVPKHIWENEDVTTFTNTECVWTGPYVLKEIDSNGNWLVFEKREDWDASATGIIFGEPVPQYVMFITYGDEDKAVMAAINNEVDILCTISAESWSVLAEKNEYATAWYDGFPYGAVDTACAPGLVYNCGVEPIDNVNVRWALTLAMDIESIAMSVSNGMWNVSVISAAPVASKVEAYHKPIAEWLESFTLSDGYSPFNSDYASEVVATLNEQGVVGLPSDEEGMKEMFGLGWWDYDTEEAENLLLAEGFTRDDDGMWLLPDGTSWKINLAVTNSNARYERMGYAIVECWQQFGIDAVVQSGDDGTVSTVRSQGTADCYISAPDQSALLDLTSALLGWDSENIAAIGETTPSGTYSGAVSRYSSDKIDSILEELSGLTSDEERVTELVIDFYKEIVSDIPYLAMSGVYQIRPTITYYWNGMPNSENENVVPTWWASQIKALYSELEPTGNQ